MRDRDRLAALVWIVAVVFGARAARASLMNEAYVPVAQSYSSISFQGGRTAGTLYHATDTFTFNSLGFVDVKANPVNYMEFNSFDTLLGSYVVSLWRVTSFTPTLPANPLTGTLLASTTVTPASPLESFSQFRYAPIAPTTILAGEDFIVAALLPDTPLDAWLVDNMTVNKTGITGPGRGFYEIGSSLASPTQSAGVAYAIANASTTFTPEPSTLGLLGLGGGVLVRRRRREESSH